MKYLKPEIRVISAATNAIAGLEKPINPFPDSVNGLTLTTPAAYEADE